MEHIAAVQQNKSEKSGDKTESEKVPPPTKSHLVQEAQIETQEDHLILGLLDENKEPLAGIKLSRIKAHQVLRMLMEQAT